MRVCIRGGCPGAAWQRWQVDTNYGVLLRYVMQIQTSNTRASERARMPHHQLVSDSQNLRERRGARISRDGTERRAVTPATPTP